MNFAGIASLPVSPETGTWYRCVAPRFQLSALSAQHTLSVRSRFGPGRDGTPPFQTLYFAENSILGAFEIGAIYGSPSSPFSNPKVHYTVLCVKVRLSYVVDITEITAQALIDTNAQELTGDWKGYHTRSTIDSVSRPVGIAPTQALGQAIKADARQIEGFITLSSKIPSQKILVFLPENLRDQSDATYSLINPDGEEIISTTIKF